MLTLQQREAMKSAIAAIDAIHPHDSAVRELVKCNLSAPLANAMSALVHCIRCDDAERRPIQHGYQCPVCGLYGFDCVPGLCRRAGS